MRRLLLSFRLFLIIDPESLIQNVPSSSYLYCFATLELSDSILVKSETGSGRGQSLVLRFRLCGFSPSMIRDRFLPPFTRPVLF
jgi:hypothetical protein